MRTMRSETWAPHWVFQVDAMSRGGSIFNARRFERTATRSSLRLTKDTDITAEDRAARKPRRRHNSRRIRRFPWITAVPAVALVLGVWIIPTVFGAWYAFTDWNGISVDANFVGFENFQRIVAARETRGALLNTLILGAAFLVLTNIIGLLLALGLNRTVKSRYILRSVFFLPVVLSPLAVGYMFQFVFDFRGLINELLRVIGLEAWRTAWLGSPDWALWAILVVMVWQYSGLTMVLYLAGLQGIPIELEEAAAVDGASLWMRFRRITLPLLAPSLTVSLTLTLIIGLRVFDQVLALTGGGPVNATETLATQVWRQSFVNGRFGYGAAFALVLVGLVAALAVVQLILLRRQEEKT